MLLLRMLLFDDNLLFHWQSGKKRSNNLIKAWTLFLLYFLHRYWFCVMNRYSISFLFYWKLELKKKKYKKLQIIHKAFKIWEGLLTEFYSNELSHDLEIYWCKLHCFSLILFNMFTFTATNVSFPFSTRSFVSPSHTIPNDPWPNSRNKHTFSLSTSHSSGI